MLYSVFQNEHFPGKLKTVRARNLKTHCSSRYSFVKKHLRSSDFVGHHDNIFASKSNSNDNITGTAKVGAISKAQKAQI